MSLCEHGPATSIDFFVDGKPYAARTWANVPRVGDEIMLHDSTRETDRHGKAPFQVHRVVWGVEPVKGYTPRQYVNIELKRVAQ